MKEINIKIRLDDVNGNKMGLAIDRTKEVFDDMMMTHFLISTCEFIKKREMDRIERTKSFKTEYTPNKDDEFKFWNGK